MKYVAFLDILGFKEKMKKFSQEKAIKFISDFSNTVNSVFQFDSKLVNGYVVSDSIILYSEDDSSDSLKNMVSLIMRICCAEFSSNGILIRGGLSKGDFDIKTAVERNNLQKELIVGQAYIEAYQLEGAHKNVGITLTETVYQDILKTNYGNLTVKEQSNDKTYYVLPYLTIDFLLDFGKLGKFVDLANEANWLPHYYNTIYYALKNQKSEKKTEQLFNDIIRLVCDGNPQSNWSSIDMFIKNGFIPEVNNNFQKRLLKYIRTHLFK